MPWVRVDDAIAFSPKVILAGNAAVGAWVRLLAWSNHNLSDGVVPLAVAFKICDHPRQLRRLVDSGMVERAGDEVRLHDFLEYNDDAETIKARRSRVSEARAQAGRKGGVARARALNGQARAPSVVATETRSRRDRDEIETRSRQHCDEIETSLPAQGLDLSRLELARAKQTVIAPPHPTLYMNKAALDSSSAVPVGALPPLVDVGNLTSDGKLTASGFHDRMINLGLGMLAPKWSPLVERLAPFTVAEVEAAVAKAREAGGKVVPGLVLRILERWRTEPPEQPKAPAAGSEWAAGRAREGALVRAEREHRKPECSEAERSERMSAGASAIGDILATVLGGKG